MDETKLSRVMERWLPTTRFARGVAMIAGGAAVSQVIGVALSPILTRLYSPNDFGVLASYSAVLGIVAVVASLRYEMAIPLPRDDSEATDLVQLSLLLALGTAILSWFAGWRWADMFAVRFDAPEIGRYFWMIPIGVLLMGTYGALNMWAIRRGAFARIGRTRIAQVSGMGAVQVGAGFASLGPIGLMAGHVAGVSSGIGTLAKRARREDGLVLSNVRLQRLRVAAARYRRFPLFSSWSALLDAAGLHAPIILLLAFYDVALVGWYSLAFRALAMPSYLVTQSVSQVFVGETAALAIARDFEGLISRFWSTVRGLFRIGVLVIPILALPAPFYFPIIFGAEWETAGRIAQYLTPFILAGLIATPVGGVLDVLERQDLHLLREVVRTALSLGTLVFLGVTGAEPLTAIAGLSLAGTIGHGFGFGVAWHAVRQASETAGTAT